jgi:hypothetical protein
VTQSLAKKICLEEIPYCHCTSRCAYLCGEDEVTGRNYEHRGDWVVALLKQLNEAFAINIRAYAVMLNHTHIVVMINQQQVLALSQEEVIAHRTLLYKPITLVARYLDGIAMTQAE